MCQIPSPGLPVKLSSIKYELCVQYAKPQIRCATAVADHPTNRNKLSIKRFIRPVTVFRRQFYPTILGAFNLWLQMDMPVNVPVDKPNADTEWCALRVGDRTAFD